MVGRQKRVMDCKFNLCVCLCMCVCACEQAEEVSVFS